MDGRQSDGGGRIARAAIRHGSASSQRQVRLTLSPRRKGRIEVPRLEWEGEQSAVIELIVAAGNGSAGQGAQAGSVADVFFTTTLDSLQPHVQSAVRLQLRLYSDKKLYQASVDFAGNTDLLVRRIGQDESSQETRNGRTYQVITRSFVLVPQRSGEIQLEGPVLNAQVADGTRSLDPFMERVFGQLQIEGGASGTRALRLRGDPVRLTAKPRPPGMGSGDWLPAQQLTIDESWQPAGGTIAVGVPVTRRLRVSAVGLSASQLPDLGALMALPAGLTSHPGAPKLTEEVTDGHIVGHREQEIVVLADRAGHFELPAMQVAWWDVAAAQRRETMLPALALDVTPGPIATPAAPAPTAGTTAATGEAQNGPPAAAPSASRADVPASSGPPSTKWIGVSVTLALLWLATLGAWAWTHRQRRLPRAHGEPARGNQAAQVSAATAMKELRQACQSQSARSARDALLSWARATLPQSAPPGLNALARRLDRADVTPLLRELDRACVEGSAWNGEALDRSLGSLEIQDGPEQTRPVLPGLYEDQGKRPA